MVIAKVSSNRGIVWIKTAIGLVMDRPVPWIGGTAALLGLTIVFSLIPFLGGILSQILNFAMGLFFLCYADAQRKGMEFDFDRYFEQGKGVLARLILMLILNAGLMFLCSLPVLGSLLAAGGTEFLWQQSNGTSLSTASVIAVGMGGLASGIAACFVIAATCFTTPLILFQNQTISAAIRLSLKAVGQNILPLILYAILLGLLMFIGIIPFGLGLLLCFPAVFASFYVAYEEILGKQEAL